MYTKIQKIKNNHLQKKFNKENVNPFPIIQGKKISSLKEIFSDESDDDLNWGKVTNKHANNSTIINKQLLEEYSPLSPSDEISDNDLEFD